MAAKSMPYFKGCVLRTSVIVRQWHAADQADLFISFRQPGGNWTQPVGMGEAINSPRVDRFPAVSPDGEYLFFTQRTRDHDEDVFWVSADIIERLRTSAR